MLADVLHECHGFYPIDALVERGGSRREQLRFDILAMEQPVEHASLKERSLLPRRDLTFAALVHLHHNDFSQQVRPRITQGRWLLLLRPQMAASLDGLLNSVGSFPVAEEAPNNRVVCIKGIHLRAEDLLMAFKCLIRNGNFNSLCCMDDADKHSSVGRCACTHGGFNLWRINARAAVAKSQSTTPQRSHS